MTIHHDRCHAAYVAALKNQGALAALPVQDLLARLPETICAALRNNAGGHANHTTFWRMMGGKGGASTGALLAAVDRDLGGVEAMRAGFARMGLAQFGAGWVFMTVDQDGKLALAARPDQDTPLMDGDRVLMGNDVGGAPTF